MQIPGTLYVVATPIGNLDDFSPRAVDTLSAVELVLCEDTRNWKKLADRFQIDTSYKSYFEHNEKSRASEVIEKLQNGTSVALTSDSGTPLVSDPGYTIINLAHENNIPVSPIPGPSAVIAAISVCGLPIHEFQFLGFLPVKSGKKSKTIQGILEGGITTVVFESPFRIEKTLTQISELEPGRLIFVGRELTKKFEELNKGTASEVLEHYKNKSSIKGEFVLVISGK